MLIKCKECELQVSDRAADCPHCGYPMQPNVKRRKPRNKNNKRRRLPNGFGQISEIKNQNLRNPFRAMVPTGKHEKTGRPIVKPLKPDSYFPTYNDAYAALVEYNKNPYDLNPSIKAKELYERWLPEYSKIVKSASAMTGAWPYCSDMYDMRVIDIRARHIKGCIEDGVAVIDGIARKTTPARKNNIKTLWNLMLDYAVEYELTDRNYSRDFKLPNDIFKEIEKVQKPHIPFEDEEMKKLWKHLGKIEYVDILLIQCYAGWRPQELGLIELKDVDLDNWTYTGGIKTEAGIDRVVPIHSRVRPLVKEKYNEAKELGSKYLFNVTDPRRRKKGTFLTYYHYNRGFNKIIKELKINPEHRPHDPRKHFVTRAKDYGVDEYAVKYIVGHAIQDFTEKVYTDRSIEWLKTEIEKIA